jgi:hypothetical protein
MDHTRVWAALLDYSWNKWPTDAAWWTTPFDTPYTLRVYEAADAYSPNRSLPHETCVVRCMYDIHNALWKTEWPFALPAHPSGCCVSFVDDGPTEIAASVWWA